MSQTSRAVDPALLPHERPCWCDACRSAYRRAYYKRNADKWSTDYADAARVRHYTGKSSAVYYGTCAADDCDRCFIMRRPNARKWCSQRCSERQRYRNEVAANPWRHTPRECSWCFGEYVNKRRAVRYCSDKCRHAAEIHWQLHRHPSACWLPLCRGCAQPTGKRLHGKAQWCDECSRINRQQPDSATNARRNAAKRRREAVVKGEKFSVHDLIDRDGNQCRACGLAVSFDVPPQHPAYGTIDHVVPIAAGGLHTLANCQVMHRGCNSSKGAKIIEPQQMRLI